MNKKLVAAALGLAFAAPVFADASNVTVYGRVHQAVVNQKYDGANGVASGSNVALENYASRLGVRGVEDLGGGLAAIFAYELAISTDNSTASGLSAARHSYLGFKDSAWGTFVAGTQDGGNDSQAPLYNQAQTFLGTVNNNAGDFATVGATGVLPSLTSSVSTVNNPTTTTVVNTVGGLVPASAINREQRTSNSFGYAGNIAGVAVSVRHALGGTNDVQNSVGGIRENDLRSTEVAANYKVGALEIGGGYQRLDRSAGQQTAATAAGVTSVKSVFQLGSKYTYGDLTVGGLLAQVKLEQPTAAGRDDKNSQFGLHGDYKIGKGGVYAFYAKAEREDIAANAETSQAQLAYYYDLSKRTRLYTGFNRTRFDAGNGVAASTSASTSTATGVTTTTNVAAVASGLNRDADSFVVGVRHNF
ncbi:MAG: porin [Limnobacter sp.]|uniref:porin n=1 Tax=Limnobacter sp. TaxID=2003368 RepID=UPI0039198BA0